ncbi:hypothetical protein ASG30_09295 [Ramlibacter sp. Leaf400]|nr:hypothetical protein ASG30_09295 [Ramlibacter sp. Leaf400]
MQSIHEQIKAARERRGWSMQRLAHEISQAEGLAKKLSWQTVQQWENGTSAPKRTRMQVVAKLLNLHESETAVLLEGAAEEELMVRALELPALPGSEQRRAAVVAGRLPLAPAWVARACPTVAPTDLRLLHGAGDGMEPTFTDGDMLLVDTSVRAIQEDGIYVLSATGRVHARRVRQRLDGGHEITSDNPTAKTVEVIQDRPNFEVLGRVVWIWNSKRA